MSNLARAVEGVRHNINARMACFVRSREGVVIRHRQLEFDNRHLMRTDCTHLNENGLNIFLLGLQTGKEQALFLLGGGGCRAPESSMAVFEKSW